MKQRKYRAEPNSILGGNKIVLPEKERNFFIIISEGLDKHKV